MTLTTELTVFDIFTQYEELLLSSQKSPNASSILKSALIRFFIPAVGGPVPRGSRATTAEVQSGLEYLKQVIPEQLENAINLIEEALPAKNFERRTQSVIKQFIQQAKDWGYFEKPQPVAETKVEFNSFHRGSGQARRDWHSRGKHYSNRYGRAKKKPYALMAKTAQNTRGAEKQTKLCFPNDYINKNLQEELDNFVKYRSDKSKATISREEQKIMQCFGWLHRHLGISLEELRLSSIINYSQLNVYISDYFPSNIEVEKVDWDHVDSSIMNRYLLQKALLKDNACKTADKNLARIEDYLNWLNVSPISKTAYIDMFLSVAQFIFKDEIGTTDYPESSDIPIIRKLKGIRRKYEKDGQLNPGSVPFHLKSIPWEDCIVVLEKLRLRADAEYTHSRSKRYKKGFERKKRTLYALSTDLQIFLSFAFMILLPPDRSRTYYELEIGRTLVYGLFEGRSFTPFEKLKDPSQALWYIHLEMRDYKTGRKYGTYWAPIPNTTFLDGKKLYEYIDKWLGKYRESHNPVEHNYFFRGCSDCAPLNHSDWNQRIAMVFERETGVQVPPKELRKMFVSYLKDKKASRSELEAARTAMHHSEKMQNQIYDHQEQLRKLQPIFDFNEQAVQEVWERFYAEMEIP